MYTNRTLLFFFNYNRTVIATVSGISVFVNTIKENLKANIPFFPTTTDLVQKELWNSKHFLSSQTRYLSLNDKLIEGSLFKIIKERLKS